MDQPTHKLTHCVLNTFQGRQMWGGPSARVDSGKEGQGKERSMVYVDSFRHVIYNTLWTSNRLIKYILYKYIFYCTRRPLVQPLDSMPQTQVQVHQVEL